MGQGQGEGEVLAQLIIRGVSYGFHGFMVQLRKADGTLVCGWGFKVRVRVRVQGQG